MVCPMGVMGSTWAQREACTRFENSGVATRTVAGLSVCSLLPPVNEISVSYVATHEIDERPVYDQKTGERLARHLVKIGRRTECEAMVRHQLFERVLIPLALCKN